MAVTDQDRTDDLLRRRHAEPFVPFAIVLRSGQEYLVKEPQSFTVAHGKLILPGRTDGSVRVADVAEVVERRPMSDSEAELRDALIRCLVHKPFEPFAIRMRDGRTYSIVRPLQAGIGETRGYLVTPDESESTNFHVRDIQAIEQQATV